MGDDEVQGVKYGVGMSVTAKSSLTPAGVLCSDCHSSVLVMMCIVPGVLHMIAVLPGVLIPTSIALSVGADAAAALQETYLSCETSVHLGSMVFADAMVKCNIQLALEVGKLTDGDCSVWDCWRSG